MYPRQFYDLKIDDVRGGRLNENWQRHDDDDKATRKAVDHDHQSSTRGDLGELCSAIAFAPNRYRSDCMIPKHCYRRSALKSATRWVFFSRTSIVLVSTQSRQRREIPSLFQPPFGHFVATFFYPNKQSRNKKKNSVGFLCDRILSI